MSESPRPGPRRLSALQLLGLFALFAFVAGGVVGFMDGVSGDDRSPSTFGAVTLILVVGLGGWITLLYWRRLDEAAREAHKFAWYWGGSLGMLVAFAAALLVIERNAAAFVWPGWDPSPSAYLFTGAMMVLCAQVIGYILVWIGWWAWNSRN